MKKKKNASQSKIILRERMLSYFGILGGEGVVNNPLVNNANIDSYLLRESER